MAPNKKKIVQTKVKKKKWFTVLAPKLFNNAALGESYVADSELLNGKYMTANLSTIMGNMRRQNVNMHFRVTTVIDSKAETEVIGYSLVNAAMKRLVRRGRDKIIDSFLAKTKDKKVLRIKPLIITHSKGTKSTQSAVRLEARRVIREFAFTKTVEEFFAEIADAKLQKQVKEACAKIYPLRSMDIKSAKLEENADVVLTEGDVKTEKVTIRKKDKGALHLVEEDEPQPQAETGNEEEADKEALNEEVERQAQEDGDEHDSVDLEDESEVSDEDAKDFGDDVDESVKEDEFADEEADELNEDSSDAEEDSSKEKKE
ncbi:hypothetical protein K9M74_05635 [Candidatus Woesearchaeota archaeon]|nr:hypothetical protein [Candidatus Woesearchaeota archaeon]